MGKPNPNSKAAKADAFAPPEKPEAVSCLHCGGTFISSEMRWEKRWGHGPLWWCPKADCDGGGYRFDLFPAKPQSAPAST